MNKILYQDGEFSYQDREKIVLIINKNKSVFSDEPGLVKNFKGKLVVKEKTPFAPKTYPVPYSKRGLVQEEICLLYTSRCV